MFRRAEVWKAAALAASGEDCAHRGTAEKRAGRTGGGRAAWRRRRGRSVEAMLGDTGTAAREGWEERWVGGDASRCSRQFRPVLGSSLIGPSLPLPAAALTGAWQKEVHREQDVVPSLSAALSPHPSFEPLHTHIRRPWLPAGSL